VQRRSVWLRNMQRPVQGRSAVVRDFRGVYGVWCEIVCCVIAFQQNATACARWIGCGQRFSLYVFVCQEEVECLCFRKK
jgi:hypothetical protein